MRKFNPLFAELQIMELFEFRSCLNLNSFLQSVGFYTTASWWVRGYNRCVRLKTPAMKNRADTSVCPYGKCNVIQICRGAPACAPCHCVMLSLGRHTSVCPYGKYNFIRTFVGAHRCVRPAIARRFLWADT